MSIIIFLIVLAILIFVHELGHFMAAKWSGMKVEEFAIGFSPKILKWTWGESTYSIGLIPFGGYVKILGENINEESVNGPDANRSFTAKPRHKQIIVLLAGVTMNVLFAWLITACIFAFGSVISLNDNLIATKYAEYVSDKHVAILQVYPESVAEGMGLQARDVIVAIESPQAKLSEETLTVPGVQKLIGESQDTTLTLTLLREGETIVATGTPATVGERAILGIAMDTVATVKFPIVTSLFYSLDIVRIEFVAITKGLLSFLGQAFIGQANLSQVTGPVGLVGMVGEAQKFGTSYLWSFIAFISLNLAVLNLLPLPALDGGRALFVLIEAIIRRPLPAKFQNYTNAIGFFLLIALMIVITVKDIVRLF